MKLPLRVDFAGGWLDVPRYAIPGSYIVNCAISPLVERLDWTLQWPYELCSGLGGSAAHAMLTGKDVRAQETAQGCGWQDEAIIRQTGLVAWASGPEPVIAHRDDGQWLRGLMALYWTGKAHDTASLVDLPRDYTAIARASEAAIKAVMRQDVGMLAEAIDLSYDQQIEEGMEQLPTFGLSYKYCGAGHGGYAVYLFETQEIRDGAVAKRGLMAVEPYSK